MLGTSGRAPNRAPDDRGSVGEPAVFCPGLIVPEGCECHLVVPIRSSSPVAQGSFTVCDVNGNVILAVDPQGSGDAFLQASRMRDRMGSSSDQLLIRATTGHLLVRCLPARPVNNSVFPLPTQFHILQGDGDACARLECGVGDDRGRCELYTTSGQRFTFRGTFLRHMLAVLDEQDEVVATTEECRVDFDRDQREYYSVRAAQLVDVGLLLGGLLCIDWWTSMRGHVHSGTST